MGFAARKHGSLSWRSRHVTLGKEFELLKRQRLSQPLFLLNDINVNVPSSATGTWQTPK